MTLRDEIRERLAAKRAEVRVVKLAPAPRYDSVFFRGLEWLDRIICGAPDLEAQDERRE